MDLKRLVLFMLLAMFSVSLWNAWQHDHAPQVPTVPSAAVLAGLPPQGAAVSSSASNIASQLPPMTANPVSSAVPAQLITVKTDTLNVSIDTLGGKIVSAQLLKYPVALGDPMPVDLLSNDPNQLFLAETGLVKAGQTQADPISYHATQTHYELAPDQKTVLVTLTGTNASGLSVTKTYEFYRNAYDISINEKIVNNGQQPWMGSFYSVLQRRNIPTKSKSFNSNTYTGAAISSPETPYEKIKYAALDKANLDRNILGGWLAMQQHYFLTAWIPPQRQLNHYYSSVIPTTDGENIYSLGFSAPQMKILPGQFDMAHVKLYVGPELADQLRQVAPNLDLTVDYGWLWFISKAIFWVMDKIHSFVGNWGWSIILVTILIKLLFYKLSEKSYFSMAKMRELQPKMQALKERFGNDKQKLSQATMELYRKEGSNPFGGCIPMIVQIPVFFALYYVLIEAVQLRQAPFIFWIHDLSVKDPYFVLPVLMGLSMFLQQRLSPPPPDPNQAKIMMFLPLIFTVFFLSFPAGLVLYWLVNNLISAGQQWYVMQRYEKHKAQKRK